MTEMSFFWDDGIGGDAAYSPYNSEDFNQYSFMPILGDEMDYPYVIPGYLNDLEVATAGASQHAVFVYSGAACFKNRLYILDTDVTIALTPSEDGYGRIDAIVLRYNAHANTIRLAVVEGAESIFDITTQPEKPTLTKSAALWEVPLAYVLVDGRLDNIRAVHVLDKRKFIYNAYVKDKFGSSPENLVQNSEWLGFSGESLYDNCAPDRWEVVTATLSSVRTGGLGTGSGRGDYSYTAENDEDEGICQWIPAGANRTFTLQVPYYITAYSPTVFTKVGIRAYRSNGEESSVNRQMSLTQDVTTLVTGGFTVTFPEDDIEYLYLYVTGSYGNPGQIILTPGYHTGGYRAIKEIIPHNFGLPDAAWTSTPKGTVTTTIDLTVDFAASVPPYVKCVILRLRGRDSGSAAGTPYMSARGYAAPYNTTYGTLRLGGVPNDVWREMNVIVPVNQIYYGTGVVGAQFRLAVNASGPGNFDATVEIVGLIV